MKKSSEQFSGDFSYVRKGLLFQKANLSFQSPRINDTELRQVRSCHAAINHADRHTKRMLAGGCGKRGNEARVGSESSHDDTRTDVPFPTPVLLGANIHAEFGTTIFRAPYTGAERGIEPHVPVFDKSKRTGVDEMAERLARIGASEVGGELDRPFE